MNQKELTKTFMMVSKRKKQFSLHGFYKKDSALQGLNLKGSGTNADIW